MALYSVELMILGVIVLGAMCVCGATLWWRRRREAAEGGAPPPPPA